MHYLLTYNSLLLKHGNELLGNKTMAVAEEHFKKDLTPNAEYVRHCGISDSVIITKKGQSLIPGDQSCSNEKNIEAGDDIAPEVVRVLKNFFSPPDLESIKIYEDLYKIKLSQLRLFAKSAYPLLSDTIFTIIGFNKNITQFIEHIIYERLLLKKEASGNRNITIRPEYDNGNPVARYNYASDTILVNLDYLIHSKQLSTIITHELLHAAGMDHPPIILLGPSISPLISMGLGRVIVFFYINSNPINNVAILPHLTLPSTIEHLYLLMSSGFDIEKAITILKGQYKALKVEPDQHLYITQSIN